MEAAEADEVRPACHQGSLSEAGRAASQPVSPAALVLSAAPAQETCHSMLFLLMGSHWEARGGPAIAGRAHGNSGVPHLGDEENGQLCQIDALCQPGGCRADLAT